MLATRRETAFLLVGDFLALVLSLWLGLTVRNFAFPGNEYFTVHFVPFLPVFALALVIFFIAGLYERQTRLVKRVLGIRILGSQFANTVLAAVLFFALPFAIAPKTILVLYLGISVAVVSVWRFFVAPTLRVTAREHALLVGTGPLVESVFEEVNNQPKYYLTFTEHLDPEQGTGASLPERIRAAVERGGVELVVIDTRDPKVKAQIEGLYDLLVAGVSFSEFSAFYEDLFDKVPVDHIDHAWILECLPKRNALYSFFKRTIDVVGALIGIVVAAPFIAIAGLCLMLERGEPFIFQERVGCGGKPFRLIKLRSMLLSDHGVPELQAKNRVTPLGRVLRKTRVDELPQLWNILRGELSFIGPRPELPRIAAVYEREIPYYEIRHIISPGLSGWAQIYDYDAPRDAADVERTRRKLSYDLYYLKHRSFALDLVIALKTLRALASFSGT